jgi:S-adenosylmethionine synthetase
LIGYRILYITAAFGYFIVVPDDGQEVDVDEKGTAVTATVEEGAARDRPGKLRPLAARDHQAPQAQAPIYTQTAVGGHFGRRNIHLLWEAPKQLAELPEGFSSRIA